MPDQFTPEQSAIMARHAPHLHVLESDEQLRVQLRKIEEHEAIVHAKNELATVAGIDSAQHPTDSEKFFHALSVAREESAATIELETLRTAYITDAIDKAKKAVTKASIVLAQ